ncbi:MAG TPA: hypothetical protein VHY20_06475 [Pirellulales bacterium]|jgi:hypothetical protein|nr:hypothetical protein [Pirellulales bacterium]
MEELSSECIAGRSDTADLRSRLVEKLRQQLRTLDNRASGAPDPATAGLSPASPEPLAKSLWNALIEQVSIFGQGSTALADDAETVARVANIMLGLPDAFSPFRRGILASLLLELTIGQTPERHRCTQRTVRAMLQTAIGLLDELGLA